MSQKQGPGAVPKGDVSYLRATAGQPQLPVAPSPVMQPLPPENDWDDQEEIRLRELEEARARAAQMEKTMRWWSDCTANWREKWSKVRNERNKAREENRQLRAKLDAVIKENNVVKREKEEVVTENQQLKERVNAGVQMAGGQEMLISVESEKTVGEHDVSDSGTDNQSPRHSNTSDTNSTPLHHPQEIPSSASIDTASLGSAPDIQPSRGLEELSPFDNQSEGSLAEERLALLELKLDESQKTISAEREERTSLMKTLEKAQQELNYLKTKLEDAKQLKQDSTLEVERLKDLHKEELRRMVEDLEDESTSRSSMDRRLTDLRKELEKLQRENADEWGKRERLETEKFGLERENKKLRGQIQDIEEQLERKSLHASTVVNSDMKSLQTELSDKNKELAELRHSHTKVKKVLQERVTELDHCRRRAEQYELEVKKLRARVEELKRELANAEDEVDNQGNAVRKIQRTNDELQEQVETLQVQLEHVQSRLRRSTAQTTHAAADLDDSDEDSEGT